MPGNILFDEFDRPAELEEVDTTITVDFWKTQTECTSNIWEIAPHQIILNCIGNGCLIFACALVWDDNADKKPDRCEVYLSWDIDIWREHELRHCKGYSDLFY
jgi:hypothetical protein